MGGGGGHEQPTLTTVQYIVLCMHIIKFTVYKYVHEHVRIVMATDKLLFCPLLKRGVFSLEAR